MGTALRAGNDVIQRQPFGAATVLAGVIVASQDLSSADRRQFPVSFRVAIDQPNVF
jgi:hypothetical protein